MSRTQNAARNIIFGTILRAYQLLLPFLMRSVILYYLGIQYLGLNGLFVSVIQMLNLAELGVGSAMIYSMYRPIADNEEEKICALMRLYKLYYRLIGIIIAVIGLAVTPLIPKLIHGTTPPDINIYVLYLLNLAATVFSYWFFAYRNSILEANQRTDVISKVSLLTVTIQNGLQFLTLALTKNYYLFVIVALLTQILTNTLTAIASRKLYPNFNPKGKLEKEEIRVINGRIRDLFTAKLSNTLLGSADTLVITGFLGLAMLAKYQNYYFIMTAVSSFVVIFISSCTAGIGNSLVSESVDKNYGDFKKLSLMVWLLGGTAVCCFLNLYQPFMALWMGEENLLSFGCVIMMCAYSYLYITNHVMAVYKDAGGMWHEDRFRPFCSAMFNLALNLFLVRYIGIFAIILSTVASYVVVNMPWMIKNLFTVIFQRSPIEYIRKYITHIALVIAAAVISYYTCSIVPDRGVWAIAVRLIISVAIPVVLFLIFLRNNEDFNGVLDIADRATKNKFKSLTSKLRS